MEILLKNTKTIAYFISSEKYLITTTTHKNHRQSTFEVLKMLSMMNTYKKYSSTDNNLEILYAAYGQKKRTCHTETSPFHIDIKFYQEALLHLSLLP